MKQKRATTADTDAGNEAGMHVRAWEKFRTHAPRIILFSAFVLGLIGLNTPLANEIGAILIPVAIWMVYEIILDIRRIQREEIKQRRYMKLDEVVLEISTPVRRHSRDKQIHIQVIGITLENQWKALRSLIEEVRDSGGGVHLVFDALIVDPKKDACGYTSEMQHMAQAILTQIRKFSNSLNMRENTKNWEISVRGVESVPGVAGILIDSVILFRTLTDVELSDSTEIRQGESMYERFQYPSKSGESFDNETISHFKRLFEFYTNHGTPLFLYKNGICNDTGSEIQPKLVSERTVKGSS